MCLFRQGAFALQGGGHSRITSRDGDRRLSAAGRQDRGERRAELTLKYRYQVVVLLVLLAVIVYLDRVLIAVAGPRMQQELGISPDRWGWVVGICAIACAAFEIPSGALGDRYGPRRVLTRIVL